MPTLLPALAMANVNTEAFDLRWPPIPAVSDFRIRPETKSEERRRKLPSLSPRRKVGPPQPIHFQAPFKSQRRRSVPRRSMSLEPPNILVPNLLDILVPNLLDRVTAKPKEPKRRPRRKPELLLPPMPPLAKANIMCYLAASALPIPLFPEKFNGMSGYNQNLSELRILLEDEPLPKASSEKGPVQNAVSEELLSETGLFASYKLKYDIALRRLTHHIGPSSTNRIQNIFLRMKVLDINILCSALDMITKTLLNLQNITILLPPLLRSQPLDHISAHRLKRSLYHVDNFLPSENTVMISGLHQPGYEKLEVKWRDAKKSVWKRRKSTRALKRRMDWTLSERSDVCEELGYPLPGRCPDYPRGYGFCWT